ncbi:hypothetical protein QQP08_000334 [Theobroma cacao]|nr:hypothetical protein QQP08_000334 [Theobroma cacao]
MSISTHSLFTVNIWPPPSLSSKEQRHMYALQFAILQDYLKSKRSMDNGKNPIKEEEKVLSFGKKAIKEEKNVFSSGKNYEPKVASSSSKSQMKLETASEQSDSYSAEATIVLGEMEESDDEDGDFILKLLTTDYFDASPAATKNSPVAPTLNPAAVAVAQGDKARKQVALGTVVLAPPARAPASIAKPFEIRKAMPPQELENLAKTDPKRATRIITNRRSAMRAKERKKLYTYTLQHELQKLKSQAAQSSIQLTLLGTEHNALSDENSKLKDRVHFVKRMIAMQESKTDEIRKEIQFYKLLLARQMRGAVDGSRISSSAPSANVNAQHHAVSLSSVAQQGLNLPSQTAHVHQRLQHDSQQPRAGQRPNQVRQA